LGSPAEPSMMTCSLDRFLALLCGDGTVHSAAEPAKRLSVALMSQHLLAWRPVV
jgi:hypothetical protein